MLLNFKINRFKKMTVEKSVHFLSFWKRNVEYHMKIPRKILRIISGFRMDFTEADLTLEEKTK